jgi:nucleotide-binding universal stress UspA family protein
MIEDILLPMTHARGDDAALAAAIALSAHFGAHLTVVEPVGLPMPLPDAWWPVPNIRMAQAYTDLREAGAAHAARLRERLGKETIAHEVRIAESYVTEPPQLMALHARHADLCVVAAPDPADPASGSEYFDSLLFESGRPVLVVPQGAPPRIPARRVAIAWQPTREASRAVHDALPLLRGAGAIDIVIVDPVVGETRHGEDPGIDIAAHLARHDLPLNVAALPGRGDRIAAALIRHASESGADLLVAGGFGHSRMREWVLGGTTRELLRETPIPILFSH